MKAKDIMTRRVITVTPDSTVGDIATLLLERNISAVPVIDEDKRVVGVVSEGDLVIRHDIGTDQPKHSWWLRLLNDSTALAGEYLKTHGRIARDVMTRDVITVEEDAPIAEIARVMEKNHIKRVPVLKDGMLVGIVSRANIVRQVAAVKELHVETYVDDDTIQRQVQEVLDKEPWASVATTSVTVNNGVVEFWGTVNSDAEREASRIAAEEVAGVNKVVDQRQIRSTVLVSGL